MRNYKNIFLALFIAIISACDDIISPALPEADEVYVVDAWLDNQPRFQTVKVTRSQQYFDSSLPPGVEGGNVQLVTPTTTLTFQDIGNGSYIWSPFGGVSIGEIGDEFTLIVQVDGEEFRSTATLNRVPTIDSVTFRFEEENLFLPDSYFGEFWSRDLPGEGDTYWIKAWKNGELLSKPEEINVAYDAGFSQGGGLDDLIFIPPIRDGVNPFDQDADDEFISPYADTDTLYVEIHSISEEAFDFLNNVIIQTDRPGGFAELFAQPLANVPTNIENVNPNSSRIVQGFFNMAAIEANGARLDVSQVPKD